MRSLPIPSTFRGRVLAVAVAALLLRLLYLFLARNSTGSLLGAVVPIGGDGNYYHDAAIDLVKGRGFVQRPQMTQYAGHPPLWVLTLAPVALVGIEGYLPYQLVAVGVGVLVVVAMGFLGRELGGPRCGIVTAVLAAAYPGFWTYERLLLSETLMFLVVAVLLVLAFRIRLQGVTWVRVVAIGVVAGLGALTRSELLALLPLVVVPAILRDRSTSLFVRWRGVVVAVVLAGLVIAPWSLYNRGRFSTSVPLSYGLGITMAISACDHTFAGENIGSFDTRCIATMPLGSDDAALDRPRMKHALKYDIDNIERFPTVVLAKEGRTWGFFRPFEQVTWEAQELGTPTWAGLLRLFAYWVVLPFAVFGAWYRIRHKEWTYALLVPIGMAVVTTALTYGEARYRAVAEVSLVSLAAYGALQVYVWSRARRAGAAGVTQPEGPADAADDGAGPAVRVEAATS